jgi:integrin alpha FG-GAP repeat containing protein 1
VFKFQYSDLNGRVQLATGTQLPQSTYMSLLTPYTVFGLGRTSNYIEEFFFGVPLNSSHYSYWTGSTIPNSQVVAVPYKPESPSSWTLELYITPSGLLFWILVALVISLLVLAIIVYAFYRKEKREDELQKQEQAHLFSFNAL